MRGRLAIRLVVTATAVLAGLSIVTPASAQNACTAGKKAGARKGDSTRKAHAPLIIGDSAMIIAAPYLGRLGIEADARGCRQFSAGVKLLASRRRGGSLPSVAVLALGGNGPVDGAAISRALSTIGRTRILGLVTPRNSKSGASAMRRTARRLPHRVIVLDWAAFSAGNKGWFAGDGLHVNTTGARALANFIRRRLDPFVGPPRSLKVPTSAAAGEPCGSVRRAGLRLDVFAVRGATRVDCSRARGLVRRGTLRRIRGWRAYDFQRTGRKPWSDIYVRTDRKVIVASRRR